MHETIRRHTASQTVLNLFAPRPTCSIRSPGSPRHPGRLGPSLRLRAASDQPVLPAFPEGHNLKFLLFDR